MVHTGLGEFFSDLLRKAFALSRQLLTSSDECTVWRGRTADGRVRVECLFLFLGCVQSQK